MDFCFEGVISLVCLLLGWMHGFFFLELARLSRGRWFQILFWNFHPENWEDEPILTHIFQVG